MIIVFALILLLAIPFIAIAQEPAEPTDVDLVCDPVNDFQIKWKSDADFGLFTAENVVFSDGVADNTHSFVFGMNNIKFEAIAPDSTVATPKKVSFDVPAAVLATHLSSTGKFWDTFRVKWACRASVTVDGATFTGEQSTFSPQSWWVLTIGLITVAIPVASN